MTLAHPWVLLALLVPTAVLVWTLCSPRGVGRVVALPLDYARHRPRRVVGTLLTIAALLPSVLLGVVVLLLAGPTKLGSPGQERVLTNICLLLDVSGSMSSPIGYGKAGASRYTAAMEAIQKFTSRRKGDAFGLTIFGGEVVRWVPLTKDLSAIRNATPFLDPMSVPPVLSSTRIGHALLYTKDVLADEPEGDRMVILITDGFSSDLEGPRAAEIAAELRDAHVVVHGVNVGDEEAPDQLYDVVVPTGGRVFNARDQRSLDAIFEKIDAMNPVRVKPTERQAIDHFGVLATIGAGLLGLHLLCLFGMRYTPW